jgi:PAS domain S-box-containing protein
MPIKQDVFPFDEVATVLDKALDKALADLQRLSDQIERNEWELLRLKVRSVGEVFSTFSSEGVLFVSPRGIILYADQKIERMFGYGADELNYQQTEMLIPLEQSSPDAQQRENVTPFGGSVMPGVAFRLRGLRKDGTKFNIGLILHCGQVDGERVFCMLCSASE